MGQVQIDHSIDKNKFDEIITKLYGRIGACIPYEIHQGFIECDDSDLAKLQVAVVYYRA